MMFITSKYNNSWLFLFLIQRLLSISHPKMVTKQPPLAQILRAEITREPLYVQMIGTSFQSLEPIELNYSQDQTDSTVSQSDCRRKCMLVHVEILSVPRVLKPTRDPRNGLSGKLSDGYFVLFSDKILIWS